MANTISGNWLTQFGIYPREIVGLRGLILTPFIHNDLGHVLANTLPFAVLGTLVILCGEIRFLCVSLGVAVLGGLGVWLFARPAFHVGASGLVMGYLGFLIASGYIRHSLSTIFCALLAVGLYGGALWSLLPGASYISWEGPLFGFLAGIAVALIDRGSAGRSAARAGNRRSELE